MVNWSASGFSCNPSFGANCPDLPPAATSGTLLAFNNATIQIQYDKPGSSPLNDAGLLPGGAAYEIQFDVAVTTQATCLTGAVTFSNQAFLDLSNGTTSVGDQNNANNTSQQVSTTIIGLPDCPPSAIASKKQLNPSGNTANWNSPVTYEVKVTNPTTSTLSNIPPTRLYLKGHRHSHVHGHSDFRPDLRLRLLRADGHAPYPDGTTRLQHLHPLVSHPAQPRRSTSGGHPLRREIRACL
jgi:hypothetical protein